MTNKRKHQLERRVRIEYKQFEYIFSNKNNLQRLLAQITSLMLDRISLLKYHGMVNLEEARFMCWCARTYYAYYMDYIYLIFE